MTFYLIRNETRVYNLLPNLNRLWYDVVIKLLFFHPDWEGFNGPHQLVHGNVMYHRNVVVCQHRYRNESLNIKYILIINTAFIKSMFYFYPKIIAYSDKYFLIISNLPALLFPVKASFTLSYFWNSSSLLRRSNYHLLLFQLVHSCINLTNFQSVYGIYVQISQFLCFKIFIHIYTTFFFNIFYQTSHFRTVIKMQQYQKKNLNHF